MYQVYLRSLNNSNGNGFGDILGIIEKLAYLQAPRGQRCRREWGDCPAKYKTGAGSKPRLFALEYIDAR
ncbi:alpha-amylase family glycosyl hydrolase [Carnimonas bestiolae]|uniref:alpha-amylase family glycosyl hydrolase n=1 Tax=Carnimonas bestiolae TaxID=3402172 RepID=UPI003F4A8DE8